jgi:ABC-type antimicrobial peptide transport system ATPase subunit
MPAFPPHPVAGSPGRRLAPITTVAVGDLGLVTDGTLIVLMDDGVVVEEGPPAQMLDDPREERTRRFLSAVGDR